MLLCFIVILFICVVVGVIKYSTAHSLKQEKDIKLSTIDNEKFTMEKYYTDSKPLLIIYFHPECYFCSMEMSEMLEIKRIENFNALFITNALESEVQDFLLQYLYLANLHTSFLCNLIYPTFSRILLYSC